MNSQERASAHSESGGMKCFVLAEDLKARIAEALKVHGSDAESLNTAAAKTEYALVQDFLRSKIVLDVEEREALETALEKLEMHAASLGKLTAVELLSEVTDEVTDLEPATEDAIRYIRQHPVEAKSVSVRKSLADPDGSSSEEETSSTEKSEEKKTPVVALSEELNKTT